LKFVRIKLKNFISFGNNLTEIDLDTNKITLIKGKNANGKSTIMEAVFFAFTGKPYRNVPKVKLINNINKKNLYVELILEHMGHDYVIKRGLKPNFFEIYKDDVLVNEDSHVKDYQLQLENMLGIDTKTFKQTIMMSSRYYTPFLDLSKNEKREFIENIFSIRVFSEMNDFLKRKIQITKQRIKETEINLTNVESNLLLLYNIDKKQKEQVQLQKDNIQLEIKSLGARNKYILSSIEENNLEIMSFNKQIAALNKKISKKADLFKQIDITNYRIGKHDEKIDYFCNNDNCKTCGQDIEKDFKLIKIQEEKVLKLTKEEKLIKLKEASAVIEKIQSNITLLNSKVTELNTNNITLHNESRLNSNKMDKYKSEFNSIVAENLVEAKDIEDTEKQKKDLTSELYKRKMQKQYIAKTVELISEKGIKKYIIDKYIPILNQSLNQYLKKFNAPYSVMFNSEMEENIIARGYEDLSYNNLSSGEKQRLDSALLFSFLNLSKMKNSVNVNILFMDEVLDQSLDQQGIDGIMAIFNEMKKDGYSIFVVSHREGVQENFEIIIEVGKKKFSEVSYS
jgi:DNA repair exonuclease SbcCD ATPase subunit